MKGRSTKMQTWTGFNPGTCWYNVFRKSERGIREVVCDIEREERDGCRNRSTEVRLGRGDSFTNPSS